MCESKGPTSMSLNKKAGMEAVDVDRVNEIIMNASKGSKYYQRQQERQKDIERRIQVMMKQLSRLSQEEISLAEQKVDAVAAQMEAKRDLSRVIVHVDMDAFFAAVEIRDRPELNEVPMAVGGSSMLSTSNYLARKFGVRAAMPGFIGKKLCPELVIVEANYEKYSAVSEEVRKVMATFDPDFCPMSLDEAYLDITGLVADRTDPKKSRQEASEEIVREIRQQIFERINLTCSAGIAPNARLAKVCSNINKPNGQFCVPFSRDEVMKFISDLPIGKICGIGNVSEQMLNALGVKLCRDLWDKRAVISLLFSAISLETYLSVSLGLGSTCVKSESDVRKSMSVERTFKDTSDSAELTKKCKKLSEHLSEDLRAEGVVGKVVTLKVKTASYHVKTRAHSLAFYTNSAEHIGIIAQKLLEQEIKASSPSVLVLRLMGVRMSSLICESSIPKQQQTTLENVFMAKKVVVDQPSGSGDQVASSSASVDRTKAQWTCPVCGKTFLDDDLTDQNGHIDECLNRQTVREVLREENVAGLKRLQSPSPSKTSKRMKNGKKTSNGKTICDFFKSC